jgi:hypothetical protein
MLGPLLDNGGPTLTMALLSGSPAKDSGALTDSEWDQRGPGYPRLVNGATDIGAYEVQEATSPRPRAHAVRVYEATLLLGTAPSATQAPTLVPADTRTLSSPLSQARVAVDRVFSALSQETIEARLSRSRQDVPGDVNGWSLDFLLAD